MRSSSFQERATLTPAQPLSDEIFKLVDFWIPNESETALLTGQPVQSADPTPAGKERPPGTPAQAESAARFLQGRGARDVIVTMGAQGALVCARGAETVLVPAFDAGAVVETTGAGDAFCGGFAAALSEGRTVMDAARFGCAAAGISVTLPGTAPSMPQRAEIDALLRPA